jgi:hypothetical protein
MKINLLLDNPGGARSGYLNIDPAAPPDDPDRLAGPVDDLGHAADAGEATHLVALDILDYFPAGEADAVLERWLSRLAHGGRLTMSVVDMREVARGLLAGTLGDQEANELLYGAPSAPARRSAYTLARVAGAFEELGYKVLARRIVNFRAVVTVERQ